jgi:hypothetical protein
VQVARREALARLGKREQELGLGLVEPLGGLGASGAWEGGGSAAAAAPSAGARAGGARGGPRRAAACGGGRAQRSAIGEKRGGALWRRGAAPAGVVGLHALLARQRHGGRVLVSNRVVVEGVVGQPALVQRGRRAAGRRRRRAAGREAGRGGGGRRLRAGARRGGRGGGRRGFHVGAGRARSTWLGAPIAHARVCTCAQVHKSDPACTATITTPAAPSAAACRLSAHLLIRRCDRDAAGAHSHDRRAARRRGRRARRPAAACARGAASKVVYSSYRSTRASLQELARQQARAPGHDLIAELNAH